MNDVVKEGTFGDIANFAIDKAKAVPGAFKSVKDYLTKPAGLFKSEADVLAAKAAQQNVDKAEKALSKTQGAIKTAQSQEKVAKLSGLEKTQKDKLAAAKDALKSAPSREFTTGQKVARPAALATGSAVTGAAITKGLSGEPKAVEPTPATTSAPTPEPTPAVEPNAPKPSAPAPEDDDIPEPPTSESIAESITDILKLSGQKSITARDNVVGIIKPKEIVTLNESKLDECGMMPDAPRQTASLSINATAGSGEEVANMLAAIMNLAGVKPVSGEMLGTTAQPPMPMVKAIDIISRNAPDSMNEPEEEPLSGMEEEYANTPEDPTDVPEFDSNKMAYQPNDAEPGDRMDGTLPKGFPTTKESLQQAFEAFKNGQ